MTGQTVDAPLPPQAPRFEMPLEPTSLDGLEHDTAYRDLALEGFDLPGQHAGAVVLDGVTLRDVDLSGSRMENLELRDCTLADCNLANLYARGAALSRVVIERSRLTGVVLLEAQLQDVVFRGCRMDLASLSHGRLTRVVFEDCVLTQTDFLDAGLDSVRFDGCDLRDGDLRNARPRRCEIRGTDLTGMQGVDRLRGVAMPWADIVERADLWASALGIKVIDGDPETPGR